MPTGSSAVGGRGRLIGLLLVCVLCVVAGLLLGMQLAPTPAPGAAASNAGAYAPLDNRSSAAGARPDNRPADNAGRDRRDRDDAENYRRALRACADRNTLPRPASLRRVIGDSAEVVVWADWNGYVPGTDLTLSRDVWVTVVPDLQVWARAIHGADDRRIGQVLGLPPGKRYPFFATMTVRTADLFRPAFEHHVDRYECRLDFAIDAPRAHRDWLLAELAQRRESADPWPFTALGYTFDWATPDAPVGLAEFIVRKGAVVRVTAKTPTADYVR
ncbi:MAG: hypothetical protein AB7K09_07195 [Planctomycetota bacterium]